MMAEEAATLEEPREEDVEGASAPLPTQMQLLSTWEVRRVPHNCVTRWEVVSIEPCGPCLAIYSFTLLDYVRCR